jgi:tetratricopeptide (TPR) repeat protein
MSMQTTASLFMDSPLQRGLYQQLLTSVITFQELGNRLIKHAYQAKAFRRVEEVRQVAEILCNLPINDYQVIGQYYLAWCERRTNPQAIKLFENVAETAPTRFRAFAMHSLAALAARTQDHETELYWFAESLKVHPSAEAFIGLAVIKAKQGDHRHALKDLERFYPLARYAPPYNFFDYLNSLAIELGEVGRRYEARNVIKHVLESPFIIAYPEWRETAEELKEPNRSFAFIPSLPLRPHNVLSMPAFERDEIEFPAWAGRPARILSYQQGKERMAKKKKNGKKPTEPMDEKDMLMNIINIYTSEETTDATRFKIYDAVMKALSEPDKPEKPDDDNPGA